MVFFLGIGIFLIVVLLIDMINKQDRLEKSFAVIVNETKKRKIFMLSNFERELYTKLGLSLAAMEKVYGVVRILVAIILILLSLKFGLIVVTIIAVILLFFKFRGKEKEIVEETGMTGLEEVYLVINNVIPRLVNGSSTTAAFGSVLTSGIGLSEECLTSLADIVNTDGEVTNIPAKYRDLYTLYNMAKTNEEKGRGGDYIVETFKEFQQTEMTRKSFLSDYQTASKGILTVEICFVLGLPFFLIMSYIMMPDFWVSLLGAVDCVASLVVFVVLEVMLNNQRKTIIKDLF